MYIRYLINIIYQIYLIGIKIITYAYITMCHTCALMLQLSLLLSGTTDVLSAARTAFDGLGPADLDLPAKAALMIFCFRKHSLPHSFAMLSFL